MKNTHPRLVNTGPSASAAPTLIMPSALPWLKSTAGNGPGPAGRYRDPWSVILPLGNDTTSTPGALTAGSGAGFFPGALHPVTPNNNARAAICRRAFIVDPPRTVTRGTEATPRTSDPLLPPEQRLDPAISGSFG